MEQAAPTPEPDVGAEQHRTNTIDDIDERSPGPRRSHRGWKRELAPNPCDRLRVKIRDFPDVDS